MTVSRVRMLPWATVIPLCLGLAAGVALGAVDAFEASGPSSGIFGPDMSGRLAIIAIVGGGGLLGLLLRPRRSTRNVGLALLLIAAGAMVGFVVGAAFGPRWQYPRDLPGRVELHLTAPVDATLEAAAMCTTEDNGDTIVLLSADPLGEVGIDQLGVRLSLSVYQQEVTILVNQLYGYEGAVAVTDRGPDSTSGSASFADIRAGVSQIGGTNEGASASGSIVWSCGSASPNATQSTGATQTPGASGSALPVRTDALQGFFTLHGIVEIEEARAQGTCSTAYDLRTNAIETVAPWTGGGRARLLLAPGPETSTLTVQPEDGSSPITVTAPSVLTELQAAAGSITDRRLTATFKFASGSLDLFVEWVCGDQIEGQKP